MTFDPRVHHRRSIRLRGYDYATAGAYFATVVVEGRACHLGNITDGVIWESAAGAAVRQAWFDLPKRFGTVALDAFVVMPNHVHGLIVLHEPGWSEEGTGTVEAGMTRTAGTPAAGMAGAQQAAPLRCDYARPVEALLAAPPSPPPSPSPSGAHPIDRPAVMRAFKSLSAIAVNRILGRRGQPLWQRNYYEHIIRNDAALDRIRTYILTNSARRDDDRENPLRLKRQTNRMKGST